MSQGFNQRRHHRTDSLNLSYFNVDEDDQVIEQGMGRTLNISQSGILLETTTALATDQNLDMEMAMHDQIIIAKGRVVHCQELSTGKYQAGVEFTTISDQDLEIVKSFV